eukprot:gene5655-6351_t
MGKLRHRSTLYYPANRTRKVLKCSRCRNHGVLSLLRGHKKNCPYRDCKCPECNLVNENRPIHSTQLPLQREKNKIKENAGTQPSFKTLLFEAATSVNQNQVVTRGQGSVATSPLIVSSSINSTTQKLPNNAIKHGSQSDVFPSFPLGKFNNMFYHDQNYFNQKSTNTTTTHKQQQQLTTTRPEAIPLSITNSFSLPQSSVNPLNQNFRPLSYQLPSQHVSMLPHHDTRPLSHKGPYPSESTQHQQQQTGVLNFIAENRSQSLKIRHLNLLTRLFPQFSDIFINSVLEEARGEFLAAAEWLVQFVDRRSFMYPYYDTFVPLPYFNPYYGNIDCPAQKQGYTHQPYDGSIDNNTYKYMPATTIQNYTRFSAKDATPLLFDATQGNSQKFGPQIISAAGPMNGYFQPNQNGLNKTVVLDTKPYSRTSRVQGDNHAPDRGYSKMFPDNNCGARLMTSAAPQGGCYDHSSGHQLPQVVQQENAMTEDVVHENTTTAAYDNCDDDSNGYATERILSDTDAIGNMVAAAKNITAAICGPSFVCATSQIGNHIGNQDEVVINQRASSKLQCFSSLLNGKERQSEDEEQLSAISEYIQENERQDESAIAPKRPNREQYREADFESDLSSSKGSNELNL